MWWTFGPPMTRAKATVDFPHEYFYEMINSGVLEQYYQIDPKNSWMVAAAERNLPIICPGWEDSTMGNIFAGHCIVGELQARHDEERHRLHDVPQRIGTRNNCGRLRASDSSRSVAVSQGTSRSVWCPCSIRTCSVNDVPFWSYFCQISDSTTSYGSYSAALFPMRRSRGASSISTPRNSSLKAMLLL
jgi:deoxyhypusine synthase